MIKITCKPCLDRNHKRCIFEQCYCKELGHPNNMIEVLAGISPPKHH